MHIKSGLHTAYSPIGIDIGTRSLNVVQLGKTSDGLFIHEADIRMLPEDTLAEDIEIGDALSDIVRFNNFRGKEVVTRMHPSQVSIIPLKISLREGESEEQAVLRESKEYLPCPIEEAVIDYLPISHVKKGSEEVTKILLIFVKRSDVVNHINLLKKIGLKVNAIDIGPNAINRAIKKFRKPPEQHIMVINIGDSNSFSTILWEDMILIDRKMGWGENNIIEKIVSNLDVEIYEARRIMYRYGIDWSSSPRVSIDDTMSVMPDKQIPSHIFEIVAPGLEDLNKEIEKMLIYCTSEMKGAMIDKIYLMGSGGLLMQLNSFLQKSFGIVVSPFVPEEIFVETNTFKKVVQDNFPIFMISTGLALRGYDA